MLDAADTGALRALARGHGEHSVVHAVWAFVLSRYTRSRTVLFGSIRPNSAVDGVGAGTALATLPVLLKVDPDDGVGDLTARVADRLNAVDGHGMTSLSTVQSLAGRPGAPLFDTAVVCETGPAARTSVAGISVTLRSTARRTGLPIVLTVDDGPAPSIHRVRPRPARRPGRGRPAHRLPPRTACVRPGHGRPSAHHRPARPVGGPCAGGEHQPATRRAE